MNDISIIFGILAIGILIVFIVLLLNDKLKLHLYNPIIATAIGVVTVFIITPSITELAFYFHLSFFVITISFGIGAFVGGFITVLLSNKSPLIGILPIIPYIITVLLTIGAVESALIISSINIIFALVGSYIGNKTKKSIINN
ncbi:hypothetical protein Metbo_1131 [Methanobacterium lacus]|uniref:Uncharacterized protein n=1 Tax=Methanobacterium lacus (strain AL-21) TaxID=877455 RepID=F0T5Y2_METLA|nr:hypothetical protein [Methanobacterium lacus]ADZ09375.1 hypothetical protein Metbo_1131 [Methanobacterium lacus]